MSGTSTGLIAQERSEPLLQFLLFKSMDYGTRTRWTVGCAAAAVLAQAAFFSAWPGVPFLIAALLLSWTQGFDNHADFRAYRAGSEWQTVPYDRLADIPQMDRRIAKWDASATDFTSGAGAALFLLAVFAIGILTFVIWQSSQTVATVFVVDAVALLAFQWFNGMRTIDRKPDLTLKAMHLVDAVDRAGLHDEADLQLQAQLLLKGEGEQRVPTGAKVLIGWNDAPDWFLGVQSQVVINRVQDKPYPYCYAVLVAREGNGLADFARSAGEARAELVCEVEEKNGVDIVILRQHTTKTTGYHTAPKLSATILTDAVELARGFLDKRG